MMAVILAMVRVREHDGDDDGDDEDHEDDDAHEGDDADAHR